MYISIFSKFFWSFLKMFFKIFFKNICPKFFQRISEFKKKKIDFENFLKTLFRKCLKFFKTFLKINFFIRFSKVFSRNVSLIFQKPVFPKYFWNNSSLKLKKKIFLKTILNIFWSIFTNFFQIKEAYCFRKSKFAGSLFGFYLSGCGY